MVKLLAALLIVCVFAGFAFAKDFKAEDADSGFRRNKLKEANPEMMQAFGNLGSTVLKDGAVSLKTKELIAVSLSVANHCETCIMSHVKNAIAAGVTREELADSLGVAVLMGGGPSSVYAAAALEVYDQFTEQKAK